MIGLKAIILGAGRGKSDGVSVDIHKSLQRGPAERRALDWIIRALKYSDINNISFVAGYQADKIMNEYPHLRYYINKQWKTTNVSYSLYKAINELDGDVVICYSDVVFHPTLIEELTNQPGDIVIATKDLDNEAYQGRMGRLIQKIDKVCVKQGNVEKIGKNLELLSCASSEFVGLIKLTKNGANLLKNILLKLAESPKTPIQEAKEFKQSFLTDVLQEMIDSGIIVNYIKTDNKWMELDGQSSLSSFVFGTKAETLERLQPELKTACVLDQIRIEVREWEREHEYYLDLIQQTFTNQKIIIRSSTFAEDSKENSFAGAFESVLNVSTQDKESIRNGIKEVINSYKERLDGDIGLNQVLIQPQLENVKISGVVMTRDLTSGAPYYIVNYDDRSSLTDTITSGTTNLQSLICLRSSINHVENKQIKELLVSVMEVEKIVESSKLDIEFAIDHAGDIYIFQVRPITTLNSINLMDDKLEKSLQQEAKRFQKLHRRQSLNLYGRESLFANMPDWNPAEIVGVRPKPLAFSLYKYLITDSIWAESRKEIGYHSPSPEPLMVEFAGQPYIDTRVSFNSLIPASLDKDVAKKLMNFYTDEFKRDLQVHDKVEFELLFTSYDFDMDERLKVLSKNGFTNGEIDEIRNSLINLTNNIIKGEVGSISTQDQRLIKLKKKREFLLSENSSHNDIYIVKSLLDDCKKYGTLPFSILARYAFIAVSFLKSFVHKGILSEDEYDSYLKSIETVATHTIDDLDLVTTGELTIEKFLDMYGHLRPGTYDITSPRYDEAFEQYFDLKANHQREVKSSENSKIIFSQKQIDKINQLLTESELTFTAMELFEFMEKSIVGRESAKFEFSKNLSLALQLLTQIGESKGIPKESLQFATIEDLNCIEYKNNTSLLQTIKEGIKHFEITENVKLPSVITSEEDFFTFIHHENRPNFITQKSVVGEVLYLNSITEEGIDLSGKIIAIENADPGYDWIFSYDILGLITKFGGANSHMAIRSAEFNLPAAIGCGDVIFDNVAQANRIKLMCGEQRIETL